MAAAEANWNKRVRIGVVIAVLVLLLVVLVQNNKNQAFHVLFWTPQVPPSLLLLGAFAVGVVAGSVGLHLLRRRR
jgi:uncharacterized integral membrane protein